jgi:hypothetical protein
MIAAPKTFLSDCANVQLRQIEHIYPNTNSTAWLQQQLSPPFINHLLSPSTGLCNNLPSGLFKPNQAAVPVLLCIGILCVQCYLSYV